MRGGELKVLPQPAGDMSFAAAELHSEAALAGTGIGTMPYPVFQKLWKHPMTDIGLERFLADWKKTQK